MESKKQKVTNRLIIALIIILNKGALQSADCRAITPYKDAFQ